MDGSILPYVTESELRALRIAARQMPWTNPAERVEKHPLGRGYVARLMELELVAYAGTSRGKKIEITALAVEVLRAHWLGERFSVPLDARGEADEQQGHQG